MSRTQINATLVNLTTTPVTQMTLDAGVTGNALQIKEQGQILFYDSLNANNIFLRAPTTLSSSYPIILPSGQGGSNTFLRNDGSGNLSWVTVTDTGITQLTGDATAGPGSGSQALTLASVNGNVGSFTNANITVNAKGLITAASSGSAGGSNQVASPTTTYNATTADAGIFASATGGAFAVNLPAASAKSGQILYIKKIDSSANAVTVTRAGSDTIDGATTFALQVQYAELTIMSNGGTSWWII